MVWIFTSIKMNITAISDLHGHFPELEGGDLLIIAGDLTARDTHIDYCKFENWIVGQNYSHIIIVGGNHDNFLTSMDEHRMWRYWNKLDPRITYLCDSGTEFEGLRIWGTPWTKSFEGMNPKCKAFTVDTEEELAEKWALIPDDIDILVTHSPPYCGLDKTIDQENVGSKSLRTWVFKNKPRLHVFGHIHESYGIISSEALRKLNLQLFTDSKDEIFQTTIINASHVNERYEPVNKPVRIEL